MTGLREIAQGAKTILIAGHLRPDGDCVGAAVAAYLYLKKIYPEAQIGAYVEKVPEVYRFLDPEHSIFVEKLPEGSVDLFLSLDSSTKDRLGEAERLFDTAARTACIDLMSAIWDMPERILWKPAAAPHVRFFTD